MFKRMTCFFVPLFVTVTLVATRINVETTAYPTISIMQGVTSNQDSVTDVVERQALKDVRSDLLMFSINDKIICSLVKPIPVIELRLQYR